MKKVEIYSTPNCHFCQETKKFLKEKEVEFTDYNVAEDVEKRKEMMEKTGQMGVPVVVITEEGDLPAQAGNPKTDVVVGFDEPKLTELLGL